MCIGDNQNMSNDNIYYLMHKNIICATIVIDDKYDIKDIDINNTEHLPYTFLDTRFNKIDNMLRWIQNRSIPKSRRYYERIKHNLKNMSAIEIVFKCKALRLTDCYWLKEQKNNDTWESVNYFDNKYSDILDNIYINSDELNDNILLNEDTLLTPNATTEGNLPKVWKKENGIWKLYKSNEIYNEGDNEVIWSKILDYVGIKHINYYIGTLERRVGNETQKRIYSVCDNYCSKDKELISAYEFSFTYKKKNDKNDIEMYEEECEKRGLKDIRKFISDMLIMDFILANSDRHWHNFGVIRNPDTLELTEIMPLYDNGNSLWFKNNIKENFGYPNLNFTNKSIEGETTKQCLRYVNDWSLLDNERIYDIPKIYSEIKLEVNDYSDANRTNKELESIKKNIEYLYRIKQIGYKQVSKENN